jgi:hypothetical protein
MKRVFVSTTSALAFAMGMIAATPAYAAGPPASQIGRLCGLAAGVLERVQGLVPASVYEWALAYYNSYCL